VNKVFARTLLTLVLATLVALAFWVREGVQVALTFLALVLILLFLHHAWMMARLAAWIEHPNAQQMPSAYGAWSDLFAALYRLVAQTRDSQARLAEALRRFRQAGEVLPDGVITLNPDGRIDWMNPASERHFARQAAEGEGRPFADLLPDADTWRDLQAVSGDLPLRVNMPGAAPRVLDLRRIAFGSGQALIFSEDVTRAAQIETMRRDFVANVSHELRTPLTVLRGFAETLQEADPQNHALREKSLQRMVEQAGRMQRLVEDLLMLSRLEDAGNQLSEAPVDVPALIASLIEDAEALSAGRHTFVHDIAALNVLGNADELRSAFFNLLTNAVRYTPQGGTIHVSWSESDEGLRYSVQDSGEGIAAQHIERLTERFYRVDKGRSRGNLIGGGGTGLGLSIVKHVMLRHGGRLTIASEVGVGSTFSCVLPVTRRV
jgi:two-component system phosphate regulon sensor histidine kinase PhoR